jgi:hypothetical protein
MGANDTEARAPRRIVESSMIRVAETKIQFIRAFHGVGERDLDRLNRELHAEVLGYYLALKPYSWSDGIEEKWENAQLWRSERGQWVEGLDELSKWIQREREVQEPSTKRGGGARVVTEPAVLDPEKLIRVAGLLDDIARQLGITMQTSGGARPAAAVPTITREDDEAAHADGEAATDGGRDE